MSKIINFILRIIAKIILFVSSILLYLGFLFVLIAFFIAPDGKVYTRNERIEVLKRLGKTLKKFVNDEKSKEEGNKIND